MRVVVALCAAASAALSLLAACAPLPFRAGQTEAEVIAAAGPPTGRYAMPGGATRLEYASGPMGRTTWMVDLDAQGRVVRWDQVLNEAQFAAIADGMPREVLLRTIGRPAHRAGEWMNRETWSWRYPTNDCLWFRVTLSPQGKVIDGGGYMIDPICDAPPDRE
jgi:hypothetical protein